MVKITPSILVEEIRGRWGGSIFQMWKNQIYCRKAFELPDHPTSKRQNIRGSFGNVSSCFYLLSSIQQTCWNNYASLLPSSLQPQSGYNQYLALNMRARLIGTAPVNNPPLHYDPPNTPVGLSAQYNASTENINLSWANPSDSSLLVMGFFSVQVHYSSINSAKWKQAQFVCANIRELSVDVSDYPDGYTFYMRANTLTTLGVTSPDSIKITVKKT